MADRTASITPYLAIGTQLMLSFLVATVAALYLGAALYLARGIVTRYARRTDQPPVTIVVPVRNEEQALPRLLNSLAALDYPRDLIELILIDDQSSDRTVAVAQAHRSRLPFPMRIIDVREGNVEGLTAKTRPLAVGIEAARTELILMTDADCEVSPNWASGMVSHFADDVGMVCGVTLPAVPDRRTLFSRLETLDWLFLIGSCAAFSGRQNAQALIGNNYAVRASTYRRLGTYRSIPHNKVDDIALMLAVKNERKERIVMPAEADVVVRTQPLNGMRELVGQRYRWLQAWPFARPTARLVLAAGILVHTAWPIAALLLGIPGWLLLGAVAAGDGAVIYAMAGRCAPKTNRLMILAYPLFATIYGWWLSLLIVSGSKIVWKQREF
ncbi:glycosyltransferase [candidate division KSB1 bacterium]|nr:glycosyltransferase [candidate division KSB1 bacterium]